MRVSDYNLEWLKCNNAVDADNEKALAPGPMRWRTCLSYVSCNCPRFGLNIQLLTICIAGTSHTLNITYFLRFMFQMAH